VIRIGVLSDMSGSTADSAGQGSVVAARLAVEDVGGAIGSSKIEVLAGNSQAKADNALSIARQWIDQENVHAIVDLPYTQVALAVSDFGRQLLEPERGDATLRRALSGAGRTPTLEGTGGSIRRNPALAERGCGYRQHIRSGDDQGDDLNNGRLFRSASDNPAQWTGDL